ncbi:hypothetical protein [Lyngbya confervoides]|uniref:Uncharacterized protein n=1 Tax=Lyngbya confervoides BDU141951 TaxID=1574623 RepID=A0ABD4T2X1_9CYAN|nr:hypothetical protein [Lyngbya confervoides]MCM1983087.1 hypothetical protein [Lyngbya confervoides BDU141951]
MKHSSFIHPAEHDALNHRSFINLKDYLNGAVVTPNPYASIDEFLDETWNLAAPESAVVPQPEIGVPQSSPAGI